MKKTYFGYPYPIGTIPLFAKQISCTDKIILDGKKHDISIMIKSDEFIDTKHFNIFMNEDLFVLEYGIHIEEVKIHPETNNFLMLTASYVGTESFANNLETLEDGTNNIQIPDTWIAILKEKAQSSSNSIEVIKLNKKATLPTYGDRGPIIYFYSLEGFRLKKNKSIHVKTGLRIKVPKGYVLELTPLDYLTLYNGIVMPNAPYYITEMDYDKELTIPLCYNDLNIDGEHDIDWFGDLKFDDYIGKPIAKGILKKSRNT